MFKSILSGLKYGFSQSKVMVSAEYLFRAFIELSPLLFAVIWAKLIDTAINGIKNDNLTFGLMMVPFLLYAVIEVVKSLSIRIDEYLQNRIFDKLEIKLHADVIGKYASLDIQSLEDSEVNRLFQVIRGPYEWRIRTLVFTVSQLISAALLLLIGATILFTISPLVMVIVVFSALPSVLMNMKFGNISWGIWHEDANAQRKFYLTKNFLLDKENLIEAGINNITTHLLSVIKEIFDRYHKKRKPVLAKRAVVMFISDLVRISGSIACVYLLINSALSGEISVGSLILGASVFISFTGNLNTFLEQFSEMYNSGLFMKDFIEFMGLKTKVTKGEIIMPKLQIPPKIEFINISFKYPQTDRYILNDISLTINPGEKIALVGENGVGKTTLIKLLARFYELNSGKILIDGKDLASIESESWEQSIGLLTQHFNTYPAFTVEENIYFGDISKKLDESQVIAAARKANVTSFVEKYANKYKQLLSIQFDGGLDPSHGQWQRLGIARTLYRNAPIIILDEPTSAIDAQAEYEIFENINKETAGKTVIYVSHRYSTVRNADKIVVLDKGRIVESGKHEQLLKNGGLYAKNFKLQAKGYE